MEEDVRRFRTTIRVNESTLRLAESVAARYGVSVTELIDILLLTFAERSDEPPARPAQRPAARVIDLTSWRRRRESA